VILLAFAVGGYAGFVTALLVVRKHDRRCDDFFHGPLPVPIPSNVRLLPPPNPGRPFFSSGRTS
jgi:hypothetical protein